MRTRYLTSDNTITPSLLVNNMMFDFASANAEGSSIEMGRILNTGHGNRMLCLISMGPSLPSCSSFTAFLLLDVQDSVAAGARVVGVLELFHEERDQAAAQD